MKICHSTILDTLLDSIKKKKKKEPDFTSAQTFRRQSSPILKIPINFYFVGPSDLH